MLGAEICPPWGCQSLAGLWRGGPALPGEVQGTKSCCALSQGWGTQRGEVSSCWKPSAGDFPGWAALESLVGCGMPRQVGRDGSHCPFLVLTPLSTSVVALCPQMKYIQDFQREKQEFERNLARFR